MNGPARARRDRGTASATPAASASKRRRPLALLRALLTCLVLSTALLAPGRAVGAGHADGLGTTAVHLNGPWAFYWRRLLPPSAFDGKGDAPRPDARVPIPGSWTAYTVAGHRLPPTGYATYHLRLTLPSASPSRLALYIPKVYSAYRLYINGRLRASQGRVGTRAATSRGDYGRKTLIIDRPPRTLDLLFQISNFSSRVAGFGKPISLGSAKAIAALRLQVVATDAALAGGLLLIGLSQLAIFLLRRSEWTYLFFGLGVLLWAMRTVIAGQLLPVFGVHLPLAPARALDGGLALAATVFYVLFISAVFPRELSMRLARWTLLLPAAYLPIALFGAPLLRSQVVGWSLFVVIGFMVVAVLAMLRAWWRRREDAGLIIAGSAAVALSAVIQLYLFNHDGIKEAIGSVGLLCAISLQSVALARRYSRALTLSRKLESGLRRANRLKDEFLANTSHELRTPLHGMIGLAESLQERGGPPAAEVLQLIVDSGRRLARLVDDILDFTRLRHDDLPFSPRTVSLAPIVHGALATCQPLVGQRPVTLHADLPADLPEVEADPDRLHQILFNLIGNAVKFTDEGEVHVAAEAANDRVTVRIEDSGVGLAAEEWSRLQRPYEQGIEESAEGRGGVGLGLAISRQLLAMHGAEMALSPRAHGGTTVTFSLRQSRAPVESAPPFHDAKQPITAPRDLANSVPHPPEGSNPATVLVVDDDATGVVLLQQQLALSGYRVETARCGDEALEKVARRRPDLLVLDMMMPDMSGLTVCRLLREEYDPNTLPIILVTARSRPDDIVAGLDAGANDYLAKPFYRRELLARVEAQLRVHENEQMRWALSEQRRETDAPDPRALLVDLLTRSVQYWEMATGRPRADLAEASNQWTVTLDGSVRKTRTLDRYLSLETLPKRPRWRIVTRTARFVIEQLGEDERTGEIATLLEGLERALAER